MLKFLCVLVNLTKTYNRKQKGMFFSGHSVYSSKYRSRKYKVDTSIPANY